MMTCEEAVTDTRCPWGGWARERFESNREKNRAEINGFIASSFRFSEWEPFSNSNLLIFDCVIFCSYEDEL